MEEPSFIKWQLSSVPMFHQQLNSVASVFVTENTEFDQTLRSRCHQLGIRSVQPLGMQRCSGRCALYQGTE